MPCSAAEVLFEVIFENADLLVINKPAGLVCHPTKTDERSSLIGRVRLHLGSEVPAHMINRLDRETSGVVLAAKSPEVAGELGKLWEARQVEKEYLALVHGRVGDDRGAIEAPLGKDVRSEVAIKDCVRADGAAARTEFQVMQSFDELHFEQNELPVRQPFTLVKLFPKTGRKHQLRIHLAHVGHPIVGDKLYGVDEDCYLALVQDRLTEEQRRKLILPNHALHGSALRFKWRDSNWEFKAEPIWEWLDGELLR
jgi:23S rRNA pseudouridine1911/1915/1917 synthase